MTTNLDNRWSNFFRVTSASAMLLALFGLLLLGLGFFAASTVIGAGDMLLYASTVLSLLAVLLGLVCIASFAAEALRPGHRMPRKSLGVVAVAILACIPQFSLGAIGYGFGGDGLFLRLCWIGGGLSCILLLATACWGRFAQ